MISRVAVVYMNLFNKQQYRQFYLFGRKQGWPAAVSEPHATRFHAVFYAGREFCDARSAALVTAAL